MNRPGRAVNVALCVALAVLLLFPLAGSTFYLQLMTKILVMAIFAMSLDLLVGYVGLVSLGHAACFGIAGYVLALLAPEYGSASLWLTLPAAIAASALFALITGLLVLRTQGIFFIMVTLAFAQMAYFLFHDTDLGGGSDGLYIYFKPQTAIGGWVPLDLDSVPQLYYLCLLLMAAVYLFLRALIGSPFGHALQGIRINEPRMRSLGYHSYAYKLAAYVIAGSLAGLSGYLAALQFGFVNPEILSWHSSGGVLMMVILGGLGTLYGPILGAFAFVMLQELLSNQAFVGEAARHWQLGLGLFIMAVALFLPRGLAGLLWPRRPPL